jgi:hypothetical protein
MFGLATTLSEEMDLLQPMNVREYVIAFNKKVSGPRMIELRFTAKKMNLYTWHHQLSPFLTGVVQTYDALRKHNLAIKRVTDPRIIIPGEDAPVEHLDEIAHYVHETLEWVTPDYKRDLAHRFYDEAADRFKHSNRALAQHTLLMCLGIIPYPG